MNGISSSTFPGGTPYSTVAHSLNASLILTLLYILSIPLRTSRSYTWLQCKTLLNLRICIEMVLLSTGLLTTFLKLLCQLLICFTLLKSELRYYIMLIKTVVNSRISWQNILLEILVGNLLIKVYFHYWKWT